METPKPTSAPQRVRNAIKDPVLGAVVAECIKHGYSTRALAEKLNYAEGTIRNVLGGQNLPAVRRKIEELFGRPFWTSTAEWALRK